MNARVVPLPVAKISKLIGLLASDKDNVILATVAALPRTLEANGSDFYALADLVTKKPAKRSRPAPPPRWRPPPPPPPKPEAKIDWRAMERACLHEAGEVPWLFDEREVEFLQAMARWQGTPSVKQCAWLMRLHEVLMREPTA